MESQHSLPCHLLLCGDIESNPGPEQRRTNRETSAWLKDIAAQNLTLGENLEQAIVYFCGFSGDHRTCVLEQRFSSKTKKNEEGSSRKIDGRCWGKREI